MKRAIFAASALVACAALAVSGLAAPPRFSDAPQASSLASLMQKEVKWGMSHRDVTEAYVKPMGLFDREYAPHLAKLQPGVEQEQLTADRDSRKANFARAYTEFVDTPTGYDITPLKGEYSYNNGEAVQRLFKDGRTRFFFYIKDRLWKTYDEIPLKEDGPLGDSFKGAVTKLTGILGVQGRISAGDPAQGLDRTTADWQDSSTHLRAIDRSSEHLLGLVLEDRSTLANLTSLRANKPQDPFAIDPSIQALTKKGVSDPNASGSFKTGGVDAGAPKGKRR